MDKYVFYSQKDKLTNYFVFQALKQLIIIKFEIHKIQKSGWAKTFFLFVLMIMNSF